MRVYLALTGADLRVLAAGERLAAPRAAHAVTGELRAAHPGSDEEELEYAAMTAAAWDSLQLLGKSADPFGRRAVLAADVPDRDARPAGGEVPSAVAIDSAVGLEQVAAFHVDGDDAGAALARAVAGDLDALQEHELLWYARQELAALLG